tara:strand:- start:1684 stop:1860 length:177 start_codon:yes stop_codon:yes gene_type:complete
MDSKMKEYRVIAQRVTNYYAYVDANSADEAESLALQSGTDWQFMDDDDYEVYQCEETD